MRQYEFQHQPVEDKIHPMELELQQMILGLEKTTPTVPSVLQ